MTDHGIEYPQSLRPPEPDEKVEALLAKTLFIKKVTLGLLIAVAVAGAIAFGVVTFRVNTVVTAIRHTQTQNTPIARDTHALIQYVKDCQAPTGKCHLENLRQQAAILGAVDKQNRKVSAAAASCSLGVPVDLNQHKRYRLILRCLDTQATQ